MRTISLLLSLPIFLTHPLLSQQAPKGRSLFDLWDRNGDGKLVVSELPERARRNFGRVDTDGDGFISREEDAAFRNRATRTRPDNESLEIHRDIDYAGTGNPRQRLDLVLPKNRAKDASPLPVLVFIHGGGWRNGDKRGGTGKVTPFVSGANFAGASIGYRLSGEAQWPAQIHDCKAAIRWIRANAKEHGLDPDRIAVWGTSAGGHLVAMLGVSGGVAELEGDLGPHTGVSSEVACVVNFFGPAELLTMNEQGSAMDHDAPGSPESLLIGGPIQENREKANNASPVTWVSADDEPMLLVHGTEDPAVPHGQSVALKKALDAAGVPAVLLSVKGAGHGKGFGPSVNRAVETFLEHRLLGGKATVEDGEIAAGQ